MNNGDGLRVVLWLSGCNHHCPKCQNPQTWNPESGILFEGEAENELFDELKKDYISGITFSGGDPFHENNIEDVLNLINKIRILFGESKTIWLYSGYTFEQCLEDKQRYETLKQCDVFVDGRYIDALKDVTLRWRGSSNQRVIDVKQSLKNKEIILLTE